MTEQPPAETQPPTSGDEHGDRLRAESHGEVVDLAWARAAAAIRAATGRNPVEIRRTAAHDRIVELYRECWRARLGCGCREPPPAGYVNFPPGSDADAEQARLRLDERLAEVAGLAASPVQLLDAGCGIATTAIHLARRHPGLRVTGVDLCPDQVERGRRLVRGAGLADQVSLLERDYVDTWLPAASFDVILAIDSLSHCHDRPAFAREAHRLLRPGGRLVLADAFRSTKPMAALEARCYGALLEGFALADCFERPPDEVFGEAGFVEPWSEDRTWRIQPTLARASERASTLLQQVRLPPLERALERACVALHALCQCGALRYAAFRVRKPAEQE